jgi:hypothetical protein
MPLVAIVRERENTGKGLADAQLAMKPHGISVRPARREVAKIVAPRLSFPFWSIKEKP